MLRWFYDFRQDAGTGPVLVQAERLERTACG
jgi:hypothetical protein